MPRQITRQTDREAPFRPALVFTSSPAQWHSWLVTQLFGSPGLTPLNSSPQRAPSIAQLTAACIEFYAVNDLAEAQRWPGPNHDALLWRILWREMPFGTQSNWVSGAFEHTEAFVSSWSPVVIDVSCYPDDGPSPETSPWYADIETFSHIVFSFFGQSIA